MIVNAQSKTHLKSCTENGTFELGYGTAESRTTTDTMEKRQSARALQ